MSKNSTQQVIIDPRAFLRIPMQFKSYCMVYPPSIAETLEEPDFKKFFSLLTISQEDIEDQIFDPNDKNAVIEEGSIPTPYQYIVLLCEKNPVYTDLIKRGFQFFTKKEITFIPEKGIFLLGKLEDIIMNLDNTNDLPILMPEDYFEFQNLIRCCLGTEQLEPYNYKMHPKLRRMKAKQRLRDRIKERQNETKTNFLNNLASICCMGIGITPLNIGEISYAAISILLNKYQKKEKYDIDMKVLTSGFGSSKKIKPEYWMNDDEK